MNKTSHDIFKFAVENSCYHLGGFMCNDLSFSTGLREYATSAERNTATDDIHLYMMQLSSSIVQTLGLEKMLAIVGATSLTDIVQEGVTDSAGEYVDVMMTHPEHYDALMDHAALNDAESNYGIRSNQTMFTVISACLGFNLVTTTFDSGLYDVADYTKLARNFIMTKIYGDWENRPMTMAEVRESYITFKEEFNNV